MNRTNALEPSRLPSWIPRTSDEWALVFFLLFLSTIPLSKAISSLSEGAAYTAWFLGQFNPITRHERWRRLKQRRWLLVWGVFFLWTLVSFFWTTHPGEMLPEINRQHSLLTLPLLAVQLPFTKRHFRLALGGFVLGNLIVLGVSALLAFDGVVDDQMKRSPSPDGKPVVLINGSAPFGPTLQLVPKTTEIQVSALVMGGGDTLSISAMHEAPHIHLTSHAMVSSQQWQPLQGVFHIPKGMESGTWVIYVTGKNFKSNNYSGKLTITAKGETLKEGYGFDAFRLTSPFEQRPRASLFFAFSFLAALMLAFNPGIKLPNTLRNLMAVVGFFMMLGLVLMGGRIGQVGALFGGGIWAILTWKHLAASRWRKWILPSFIGLSLMMIFHPAVQNRYLEAWKELRQGHGKKIQPNDLKHSSIGLRMAYYRAFGQVSSEHPIFGIGMGDLKPETLKAYEAELPGLEFQRPHNQFLEVQLLYGIPGSMLFILCLAVMVLKCSPALRLPMVLHSLLVVFSMLTDSTLATQAGVSYVMGFYCLIFCTTFNKSEEKAVTSDFSPA